MTQDTAKIREFLIKHNVVSVGLFHKTGDVPMNDRIVEVRVVGECFGRFPASTPIPNSPTTTTLPSLLAKEHVIGCLTTLHKPGMPCYAGLSGLCQEALYQSKGLGTRGLASNQLQISFKSASKLLNLPAPDFA